MQGFLSEAHVIQVQGEIQLAMLQEYYTVS